MDRQLRLRAKLVAQCAEYMAQYGPGAIGTVFHEAVMKAWLMTHPDQPETPKPPKQAPPRRRKKAA